jgi:hypothetical protein
MAPDGHSHRQESLAIFGTEIWGQWHWRKDIVESEAKR